MISRSLRFRPFVTNRIPYQLTAGDEVKVVYLQVKDTANNDAAPLSSTIVLDTQAPDPGTLAFNFGLHVGRVRRTVGLPA